MCPALTSPARVARTTVRPADVAQRHDKRQCHAGGRLVDLQLELRLEMAGDEIAEAPVDDVPEDSVDRRAASIPCRHEPGSRLHDPARRVVEVRMAARHGDGALVDRPVGSDQGVEDDRPFLSVRHRTRRVIVGGNEALDMRRSGCGGGACMSIKRAASNERLPGSPRILRLSAGLAIGN